MTTLSHQISMRISKLAEDISLERPVRYYGESDIEKVDTSVRVLVSVFHGRVKGVLFMKFSYESRPDGHSAKTSSINRHQTV